MYSVGGVDNTFPMPPKGTNLSRLEPLAEAVPYARTAHSGATLADLYDPDLIPSFSVRLGNEPCNDLDPPFLSPMRAGERGRWSCRLS